MNIFVGSLPYKVRENELREAFEKYGEVVSARVIMDKFTGRSKGFGFVEMNDEAAAKRAIEELNGSEMDNRAIVVNEAHERTENNRRFGNGNNYRRD